MSGPKRTAVYEIYVDGNFDNRFWDKKKATEALEGLQRFFRMHDKGQVPTLYEGIITWEPIS